MQARCASCRDWRRTEAHPASRRRSRDLAGHCQRDDRPAHGSYGCARFRPTQPALAAALGLGPDEIATLRAAPDDIRVVELRRLWWILWDNPSDAATHDLFATVLERFRVPKP